MSTWKVQVLICSFHCHPRNLRGLERVKSVFQHCRGACTSKRPSDVIRACTVKGSTLSGHVTELSVALSRVTTRRRSSSGLMVTSPTLYPERGTATRRMRQPSMLRISERASPTDWLVVVWGAIVDIWGRRKHGDLESKLTIWAYIEGILPKGPYLPCVSMAGRVLLAGYPLDTNLIVSSKENLFRQTTKKMIPITKGHKCGKRIHFVASSWPSMPWYPQQDT